LPGISSSIFNQPEYTAASQCGLTLILKLFGLIFRL